MISFGLRLKTLRLSKNLTQKQMAENFHMTERAYQNYEINKSMPNVALLISLADFFDVPLEFLLGKNGADLTRALLSGANLSNAKACGAIFVEADLSGADLRNADLRWADFSRANLKNAKLEGAKLEGAIFTGANVSGTILEHSDKPDMNK